MADRANLFILPICCYLRGKTGFHQSKKKIKMYMEHNFVLFRFFSVLSELR